MYKTKQELLAVEKPDEHDALAQRAVKLIDELQVLSERALVNGQTEEREILLATYYTAWAPLLALHAGRAYEFVQHVVDNVPSEVTDANLYEHLPIMPLISDSPNYKRIGEELAKGEDDCVYWRTEIKAPAVN